jgi:hypothetical protein
MRNKIVAFLLALLVVGLIVSAPFYPEVILSLALVAAVVYMVRMAYTVIREILDNNFPDKKIK